MFVIFINYTFYPYNYITSKKWKCSKYDKKAVRVCFVVLYLFCFSYLSYNNETAFPDDVGSNSDNEILNPNKKQSESGNNM